MYVAARGINKASTDVVTFVPAGFLTGRQSWRNSIDSVVKALFPVVWNVTKS